MASSHGRERVRYAVAAETQRCLSRCELRRKHGQRSARRTSSPINATLYDACLESFIVNVRLLSEFLIRGGSMDHRAHELVPEWSAPPGQQTDRLGAKWWQLASRHVVHLSKQRSKDGPVDDRDQMLRDMRDDALFVWNDFSAAYLRATTSATTRPLPANTPL